MSNFSTAQLSKEFIEIDGKKMAFHQAGEGRSVVFLHGNPTSSYLWRNIIPLVSGNARCIAPDLIGMGDSEKMDEIDEDSYRFFQHRHYLDGFLDALGLNNKVLLVVHDWGSALGFDWANRNRNRIAGIVYMEAIVRPVFWKEWPEASVSIFKGFRSSAGEEMILNKNLFVEAVLPGSILRNLSEEEMEEYRRPFIMPEHRLPTLKWPREIPIDGYPKELVEVVSAYAEWLTVSEIPKLFIDADPGAILTGELREYCRSWPNQTEIKVSGSHFVQEDSPYEIGEAISEWIQDLN
mgnify:CR=1 FL=1